MCAASCAALRCNGSLTLGLAGSCTRRSPRLHHVVSSLPSATGLCAVPTRCHSWSTLTRRLLGRSFCRKTQPLGCECACGPCFARSVFNGRIIAYVGTCPVAPCVGLVAFITWCVCHDNVQMLMSQDPTQQQECMQTFFSTCRELAKAFDPVDTSVAGTYATAFPMAAPVL